MKYGKKFSCLYFVKQLFVILKGLFVEVDGKELAMAMMSGIALAYENLIAPLHTIGVSEKIIC